MSNEDLREFFESVGTEIQQKSRRRGESIAPPSARLLNDDPNVIPTTSNKDSKWVSSAGRWRAVGPVCDKITAGVFKTAVDGHDNPYLEEHTLNTDELIMLPSNKNFIGIIKEFRQFWSDETKEAMESRGFLHKRGFLLYGPAGSGKTSLIQLMNRILVDSNGIVLLIDHPHVAQKCLTMVRAVERELPIIGIIEDLEAQVENGDESAYLNLLDGANQVSNVLYIATTNYPGRLDRRFTNRPSRFDRIIKIGMPSSEDRYHYLKTKEPSLSESELRTWTKESEGFSIAHLRELIVSVQCFKKDFQATIDYLREMKDHKISDSDSSDMPKLGFVPR